MYNAVESRHAEEWDRAADAVEKRAAEVVAQASEQNARAGRLAAEAEALALRVERLEQRMADVIAGEPDAIITALQAWLKRDAASVASALRDLLKAAAP